MAETGSVDTPLMQWGIAIDRALYAGQPEMANKAAQVVLRYLPQHLPTYVRLLRGAWQAQRWKMCAAWAERILRADPGNPQAWQGVAIAAEQKEKRLQSQAAWQRAFEGAPFDPEIRAGVSRTSLKTPGLPRLNPACLAALYLQGRRWLPGVAAYAGLMRADAQRVDFQMCWMVALWQAGQEQEAYRTARYLIEQKERYLLMAWVVLADVGDENDRALAQEPLRTIDPTGEYVRNRFGIELRHFEVTLPVSHEEQQMLQRMLKAA